MYLKIARGSWKFFYIIALLLVPSLCLANPEGGVVAAGEATITESGPNVTINQASDKAVIDWRCFDIAPNETTKFNQPSANSITLNRIHSDNASIIAGKLSANGNIVLVNQNGFLFTKDAVIDVNSIIATSSDIDNNDFMNGKMEFNKPGSPDAMVINEGNITAKEAGLVGMVAPQVINNGQIVANGGTVQLSSGETFTVDMYGDKLMEVAVSSKLKKQLVQNKGLIEAGAGKIILTAAAGKEIVDSLIVVEGELKAPSVMEKNGEIYIYAEGSNAVKHNIIANKGNKSGKSRIEVAARIDVSGRNRREKGGKVSILADEVIIKPESFIDACGSDGFTGTTEGLEVFAERIGSSGGDIRIGGDYKGSGNTPTAEKLIVERGAEIYSDSLNTGDAGRNIFWADGTTLFYGRSYARSLGENGDGGFIETSGKRYLDPEGFAMASSINGKAGTWLLDPGDITISGVTANLTTQNNTPAVGSTTYIASATGTTILNTTIQGVLNGGTNVYITTSNDGFGVNGDITVSSSITSTSTASLNLSAYRDININAAISLAGGALTLTSDNASNSSGAITVSFPISTNNGNIIMQGGTGYAYGRLGNVIGVSIIGAVNSGTGNIQIKGKGYTNGTTLNHGISLTSSVSATGSGTITMIGNGGALASTGTNPGIYVNSGSINTVDGLISLTAVGGSNAADVNGESWLIYDRYWIC